MAITASARLSSAVQAALAPAARYVALVTRTNPSGSAARLLSRPDVGATLDAALEQARQAAAAEVAEAWGDAPPDPVLGHLLADIGAQYGGGPLRAEIRRAHVSVPRRRFTPGQDAPGSHPAAEAAAERSAAVRRAVLAFARRVSLRSRLTLAVAETAARAARTLAEGRARLASGESVRKRWLARTDGQACHWCAGLHGVTIGMDESFLPHLGGPADLSGHGRLTQPPKPYHQILDGPPLHPHCRCRLIIVTKVPPEQAGGTVTPASAAPVLAASDIRAMPEEKYKGLVAFITAAVHELGQVLRRLVSAS